jgi:GNAT superfamily N-acetyltransferase
MVYYLLYLFIFLLLTWLLFFIYLRIKFRFWALQPVFHIYDIGYLFFPPGIIDVKLPNKNRYTNFKQIETKSYDLVSEYQQNKFVQFIGSHYLQNDSNVFLPKKENILPYFQGHIHRSFSSFYYEPQLLEDSKNHSIVETNKMIGVITSRAMHVEIFKKNTSNMFDVYYVDYLCVHRDYRNKGIAPELIQTHEYNQRYSNKKIHVCLFKREGKLTGIVPLCVYNTYGFSVKSWNRPPNFSGHYTLLEISPQNFHLLHDFIKQQKRSYDIIIQPDIANLIELIKTRNIFIYVVMMNQEFCSAYFYRKSCVYVETDLEVLTCFASICGSLNEKTFIHGFKTSFWKIAEKHKFGFAAIENISSNHLIIHNLIKKTKPSVVSPCAYFFYNFGYPTFSSNKVLILN